MYNTEIIGTKKNVNIRVINLIENYLEFLYPWYNQFQDNLEQFSRSHEIPGLPKAFQDKKCLGLSRSFLGYHKFQKRKWGNNPNPNNYISKCKG